MQSPDQPIYCLFALLDDREYGALSDVLDDDVVATTALGVIAGADKVISVMRDFHEKIPSYQHTAAGALVTLGGNKAALRTNITAVFCDADKKSAF